MHELVDGVAVVGGGLAGLAVAAILHAARLRVEVLDDSGASVPERGMCLWNGALAALEPAGVVPAIVARAAPIERVQIWSSRGRLLRDLYGRDQPVGGVAIRYAPLLDALATACADVPLHRQRLVGYAEDERGVQLTCHGGWEVRAPVAVGADGALSTVRRQCLDDGPTPYSGDSVWQGISVGLRRFDTGTLHLVWGSQGLRAGGMAVDRSGNWAWWLDDAGGIGTRTPDRPLKTELRALLANVEGPIADLVEATPELAITRTDVFARRESVPGGRGRVTLVGDAWHPMPVTARIGALLAFEDAAALGEALRRSEADPVEALRAFERSREARVAWAAKTLWSLRAVETRFSLPAARLRDLGVRHFPAHRLHDLLARLLTGETELPSQSLPAPRHRWA
jgi:2-polyprenyl-6-methoxyphenol hydroxylase-like FAD-dependent oxidoreductase